MTPPYWWQERDETKRNRLCLEEIAAYAGSDPQYITMPLLILDNIKHMSLGALGKSARFPMLYAKPDHRERAKAADVEAECAPWPKSKERQDDERIAYILGDE